MSFLNRSIVWSPSQLRQWITRAALGGIYNPLHLSHLSLHDLGVFPVEL